MATGGTAADADFFLAFSAGVCVCFTRQRQWERRWSTVTRRWHRGGWQSEQSSPSSTRSAAGGNSSPSHECCHDCGCCRWSSPQLWNTQRPAEWTCSTLTDSPEEGRPEDPTLCEQNQRIEQPDIWHWCNVWAAETLIFWTFCHQVFLMSPWSSAGNQSSHHVWSWWRNHWNHQVVLL